MLTPPDDLSDDALVRVLSDEWGLAVTAIDYRAVGFGSHHWEMVDANRVRWFVTVDELDRGHQSVGEPQAAGFDRLRAALATATALHDSGAAFVVAPIPTLACEPLARMDRRFAVALYPYVDGRSYSWGEFSTADHRRGVLELVVAVHTAPTAASRHAMRDDFAIPHRDELQSALDPTSVCREGGPYAGRTSSLLVENAERVVTLLDRYDNLVGEVRGRPSQMVLTHGEPHPGNTMLTSAGWVLIDWDTVLIAPPERDLWSLDPGDGSVISAYADAIGTTPLAPVLELYVAAGTSPTWPNTSAASGSPTQAARTMSSPGTSSPPSSPAYPPDGRSSDMTQLDHRWAAWAWSSLRGNRSFLAPTRVSCRLHASLSTGTLRDDSILAPVRVC